MIRPTNYTALVFQSKKVVRVHEPDKWSWVPKPGLLGRLYLALFNWLADRGAIENAVSERVTYGEITLDHEELFDKIDAAYGALHQYYDGEPKTIYIGKTDMSTLMRDARYLDINTTQSVEAGYKFFLRENRSLLGTPVPTIMGLTVHIVPYLRGFLIV